jgi:transcription elongation factor Elf1
MNFNNDNKAWNCPECDEKLDAEECGQVVALLKKGKSQVDLKCEECGMNITADTEGREGGEFSLNPEWVYD